MVRCLLWLLESAHSSSSSSRSPFSFAYVPLPPNSMTSSAASPATTCAPSSTLAWAPCSGSVSSPAHQVWLPPPCFCWLPVFATCLLVSGTRNLLEVRLLVGRVLRRWLCSPFLPPWCCCRNRIFGSEIYTYGAGSGCFPRLSCLCRYQKTPFHIPYPFIDRPALRSVSDVLMRIPLGYFAAKHASVLLSFYPCWSLVWLLLTYQDILYVLNVKEKVLKKEAYLDRPCAGVSHFLSNGLISLRMSKQ